MSKTVIRRCRAPCLLSDPRDPQAAVIEESEEDVEEGKEVIQYEWGKEDLSLIHI